jgi:hypothetical protein
MKKNNKLVSILIIAGLVLVTILSIMLGVRNLVDAYDARLAAKDRETKSTREEYQKNMKLETEALVTCQAALAAAQTPGTPVAAPVVRTATCTPATRVETPSLPDGPYPDPNHCHVGDIRLIWHGDRLWRVRVTGCPTLQGDDTPYTILGKSNPKGGSRAYQATDACNHGPRSYGNGERVFLCEEDSP